MEPLPAVAVEAIDVRASRLALGLSQEEFARRLGVSFATVNRWEGGRNKPRGAAAARLTSIQALVPAAQPRPAMARALGGIAAAGAFVGRQGELAELGRLARASRLVTVSGPVGGGKTRLVSEAALAGAFDGIGELSVVALSPVSVDSEVAPEVARQLGLTGLGGPSEALAAQLADPRLLVLDNCEHVLAGCRAVVQHLLGLTTRLHIIVTSREPLGLGEEVLLRLAPLDAADGEAPAVQLFLDRARLRAPTYQPGAAELAVIARLCRRLDGLPLAIELAAGTLPDLTPAEVVDRLDQRFDLLVANTTGIAPRPRELRAAIASSYDLLTDREQSVMQAAAAFVQPFTLEALEAVAGSAGGDALLVVAGLVSKSLMEVRAEPPGIRYTLLESMREFARERLHQAAATGPVMGRLAGWCAGFAEHVERGMAGREQARWMAIASLDAENVASCVEWAIGQGDARLAVQLSGSFWRYWYSRGDIDRGRRLLGAALQLPGQTAAGSRKKALLGAGILARHQGDLPAAVRYLREHLVLAEATGDQHAIAEAHNSLAGAHHASGDSARAAVLLRRSLEFWERSGDRRGLASALSNLGVLASDEGDQAAATDYGEQALALRLALGHAESIAISYENLATAALRAGNRQDARRLYGETLRRYRELGEPDGVANALEGLAAVVEPALGLTLLALADRLRTAINVPRSAVDERYHSALAADLGRQLGEEEAARSRSAAERMSLDAAFDAVEDELAADSQVAPQRRLRRRLSLREREVLELVANGQTTKEIAQSLGLSVRTVDRHLANIYAKIGARGRAEAIAFALRTAAASGGDAWAG